MNALPNATKATVGCWLLLLGACGGSQNEPTQQHEAQHHHAHRHSSPAELRPLMNDLRQHMADLKASVESDELAAASESAHAIAIACDDTETHDVDPERFGPRFGEIDRQLHDAAARLAEAAERGERGAIITEYDLVIAACVACHEQAPTAGAVDLAALVMTSD